MENVRHFDNVISPDQAYQLGKIDRRQMTVTLAKDVVERNNLGCGLGQNRFVRLTGHGDVRIDTVVEVAGGYRLSLLRVQDRDYDWA